MRSVRWALFAGVRVSAIVIMAIFVANCSQTTSSKYSPRVVANGEPVPKGGGKYRVGDPYVIRGQTYAPREDPHYRAEGVASWYGSDFHGRLTANGEVYDTQALSAAHPTLPLPSYVRVTNLENRRSVVVRVNDRGPYHGNRVIDLSARAAKLLGFYDKGLAQVRVIFIGRASLNGSDDTKLAETLRHDEPNTPQVRVAASQPNSSLAPIPQVTSRVSPQITAFAPVSGQSVAMFGRGLY